MKFKFKKHRHLHNIEENHHEFSQQIVFGDGIRNKTLTRNMATDNPEITIRTIQDLPSKETDAKTSKKKIDMIKFFNIRIIGKIILILFGYLVAYMQWSLLLPFIALGSIIWLENLDSNRGQKIKKRAAAVNISKEDLLGKINELPGWVMFPDRERAEWLNQIIEQLWPTINTFIAKKFIASIQPKIRKKYDGFRFEEVDFGSNPPKIDGIKIYDTKKSKDSIIIDFDLFYDGNCDIKFSLSGAQIGGISDFQLSVEVRIVLKPLLAKMPLIGGIQVFFLNTPDIEFSLDGISGIPGFSSFIRTKIAEKLTKKIVFPNKITKRFSKAVEASELKALEPAGVVRVHICEAKNLIASDLSGKSDPYVIAYVGAQEHKTQIINQNLNPKWDYWCEFVILDPMSQHLGIKVFDHDNVNEDDFLGSGEVDLSDVMRGETDHWLKLQQVKSGTIHLRFTWLSLSANYESLEAAKEETQMLKVTRISTALLIVYVDSAQNLPMAKPFKKPDPFFSVMVSNHLQKSRIKKHTTDPVWEQGFVCLVSDPEVDQLYLTFEDKSTGLVLDQFTYRIRDLVDEPNLEISKSEFPLSIGDGKLTISLQLRILTNELFTSELESESDSEGNFSRQNSIRDQIDSAPGTPKKIERNDSIPEEKITRTTVTANHSTPTPRGSIKRTISTTSQGDYRLGRMEVTLEYNEMRQKFLVTIHKISNLPLKDPSDIPDPYVKLKLSPAASNLKYKTKVIMDNCDPVFNETFEYLLSKSETYEQKLLLTIKSFKKFINRKVIGQVHINLKYVNLNEPYRSWYDITPERDD